MRLLISINEYATRHPMVAHCEGCRDASPDSWPTPEGESIEDCLRQETANCYPAWASGDGDSPDNWANVFRVFPCCKKVNS